MDSATEFGINSKVGMITRVSSFIRSSKSLTNDVETAPTTDVDFAIIRAKLSLKADDLNVGNLPFISPNLCNSSFEVFTKYMKLIARYQVGELSVSQRHCIAGLIIEFSAQRNSIHAFSGFNIVSKQLEHAFSCCNNLLVETEALDLVCM